MSRPQDKKSYGLIIPQKKNAGKFSALSKPIGVFSLDSSEEDEAKVKAGINKEIIQESQKKTLVEQVEMQKALVNDPTVYQYDEIYDEMEAKKIQVGRVTDQKDKKPKYIDGLLKSAATRKREKERREERKIQKERQKEGDEFEDKEAFVTSGYRKKMVELQEEEEMQREQDEADAANDVTKQKDLSQFYRHLLNKNVSMGNTLDSTSDTRGKKSSVNNERLNVFSPKEEDDELRGSNAGLNERARQKVDDSDLQRSRKKHSKAGRRKSSTERSRSKESLTNNVNMHSVYSHERLLKGDIRKSVDKYSRGIQESSTESEDSTSSEEPRQEKRSYGKGNADFNSKHRRSKVKNSGPRLQEKKSSKRGKKERYSSPDVASPDEENNIYKSVKNNKRQGSKHRWYSVSKKDVKTGSAPKRNSEEKGKEKISIVKKCQKRAASNSDSTSSEESDDEKPKYKREDDIYGVDRKKGYRTMKQDTHFNKKESRAFKQIDHSPEYVKHRRSSSKSKKSKKERRNSSLDSNSVGSEIGKKIKKHRESKKERNFIEDYGEERKEKRFADSKGKSERGFKKLHIKEEMEGRVHVGDRHSHTSGIDSRRRKSRGSVEKHISTTSRKKREQEMEDQRVKRIAKVFARRNTKETIGAARKRYFLRVKARSGQSFIDDNSDSQ